jgi:hypothetical protein
MATTLVLLAAENKRYSDGAAQRVAFIPNFISILNYE